MSPPYNAKCPQNQKCMSIELLTTYFYENTKSFLLISEPKNVITCTICTDLVGILDETITDNTTISEVTKSHFEIFFQNFLFSNFYSIFQKVVDIMHGFCDILIGLEDQCYDFVDTNVQIIVDLLVNQYLSPETICGEEFLGLCP